MIRFRAFSTVLGTFIGISLIPLNLSPATSLYVAGGNAVLQWNNTVLQEVREAKLGAPMVARALAIVHTCVYDAWAAYDERALGTQPGGALRRTASERELANKERAISYAAYRALADVLPSDTNSVCKPPQVLASTSL
jgi:hypothetical protein